MRTMSKQVMLQAKHSFDGTGTDCKRHEIQMGVGTKATVSKTISKFLYFCVFQTVCNIGMSYEFFALSHFVLWSPLCHSVVFTAVTLW